MRTIPRRDIPLAAAAFLAGFLTSAAAAGVWVLLVTAGAGNEAVVVVDSTRAKEPQERRGEIAIADEMIVNQLRSARAPSTPIRGDLRLRIARVTWNDGRARPFLRAASATGLINIAAAERGDIILDRVTINNADVLLDQKTAAGEWNYARVLADMFKEDGAPRGPRNTVRLTNVTIVNSRVEIHRPAQDLALEQLNASLAQVQFSSPASDVPVIDVRVLTTMYNDLNKKQSIALEAEDANVLLPEKRVEFTVDRARLGTTRLTSLAGQWNPAGPGYGVTLAGRADDLKLAELAWLSDRMPKEGSGSFNFAVRPISGFIMEVRLSNADIRAEGSRVTGAVSLNVGGERFDLISVDARLDPLSLALVERMSGRDIPLAGTVRGTVRGTGSSLGFDVLATLAPDSALRETFTTNLQGRISIAGGTFALQNLSADVKDLPATALRAFFPGLPFGGAISGRVTLTGPPDRAPLKLDVRLDVAGGVALVNGTLDLTGVEPAYDLNGRLIGVNLGTLLERPAPPALLTAQFALRGRGAKPETVDAAVGITGRFTGWRTQPHDTVVIEAQVRNGAIALQTGQLFLGPVHVEADGDWRFIAPETGALNYRFAIEDLAPIAPYIPAFPDSAGGKLEGTGRIAGSLQMKRIEGAFSGTNLQIAQWRMATVDGKHNVVLGPAVPEFNIELNAKDISTPSTGAYTSVTAKVQLAQPSFSMDVRANRITGGVIEVTADGRVPYEGARRVVVQTARMDIGAGTWSLQAPASIEWGDGNGINVHDFELRAQSGEGKLAVDGRVLPLAQLDARVETAALPLDEIQRLIGREPTINGLLWANADVNGPGEAPTVNIDFRVEPGDIEGVKFQRFEGKFVYAQGALNANALAVFDSVGGKLDVKAALPLRFALAPEVTFKLEDSGPITGSFVADSVALAAFASFFPEVKDVQGVLRANATVSGTVGNPDLDGTVSIARGQATIIQLNRTYTDLNAELAFDQRSAVIKTLSVRSGGTASAAGRIDFPKIADPVAAIEVTLDRFRPMGVANHTDGAASGNLSITGPLLGPTIGGHVTLTDGDLPVPVFGTTAALDAELAALGGPADLAATPNAKPPGGFFNKVRFENLRMTAGEGLWFSMHNARAQLAGDLTINKNGDDLRIIGSLEGSRGTYTLEAGPILRRFEVTHALISFQGGPDINPALDLTAKRVIMDPTGREMDIEVHVGGTLEAPTLNLASQDASNIPQSELLSYLLFGQQTLGLTGGGLPGQALLEETLLGGFAELATLELEQALGAPFDIFQIRLGGNGVEGALSPTLVLGREVSNNLFLTFESAIGALFGGGSQQNTANSFAIRLEWRIDPRTSLRAGLEPVNRSQLLRGLGVALPVNRPQQQASLEIRRRWVW